jgi:hypothetical protein
LSASITALPARSWLLRRYTPPVSRTSPLDCRQAHRRRPAHPPDDTPRRWLPHRGNFVHQEGGRGVFRIDPQADREAGGPRTRWVRGCIGGMRCNQLQSFPKRAEGPKRLFSLTLQSEPSCNHRLDLVFCRTDEGWKFRCMAVHTGDQRPEITPLPRLYRRSCLGCLVIQGRSPPALRPTWQQTLLLGNAGTHQIHPWYKKGKGGNSLSGCSCFFRATSWWSTCVLAVDRLSSI